MLIDLTKKTLDRVIAEQFPEYSSKAKEIAWNAIYNNIKELPTNAVIRKQTPESVRIKLTAYESSSAETILGIFSLEKGKDNSLSVLKNDPKASTDDYWEDVGKFKP